MNPFYNTNLTPSSSLSLSLQHPGQRTEKLFEAVDRAAKQFSRRIPTAIINEVVQGTFSPLLALFSLMLV
jgi:predicted GTPase